MQTTSPASAAALRRIAATYLGDRRAAGELRVRLAAIEHEMEQWTQAADRPGYEARSRKELAQIERVRMSLARSMDGTAERLHALEAIIAAVLAAGRPPGDPGPGSFPAEAADGPGRGERPAVRPAASGAPDAALRGEWKPPPG